MEYVIRRAEAGDVAEVARLLHQVLEVHAAGRPDVFRSGSRKYNNEEILDIFADDSRPVFVAVEGEHVLGYAFCMIEPPPQSHALREIKTLYVDDICVDESCRHGHVGTALYRRVQEHAREIGCYHITLNVWSFNEPAMRFYEKMGMSPLKVTMEQVL